MADDAGALLVRAGLIADQALATARSAQRHSGGTLGEHLVAAGAVSDDALTDFYRARLMVPQVSPGTLAKLSPTVVGLLPADMAVEFRVMPVALDKDGNLTVAMSDPSDRHAVDEIGFFTGKYVVRAVATQMQIAWCLAHYYDYVTELAERLMQPTPTPARPAAPAAPTVPRTKGDTAKVDAARHRVLVPVTTPPPVASRPGPEALDRSAPVAMTAAEPSGPIITIERPAGDDADVAGGEAAAAPPAAANANVGGAATTPAPAATTTATLADGAFGGSPTVVVSPEATRPQRARPAAPDPPELAARSGDFEVHAVQDSRVDIPIATIEINLGDDPEPEPVVELRRKRTSPPPPVEVIAGGEVARATPIADGADGDDVAVVHDTLVDTESAPILLEHFRRGEPPPQEPPVAPAAADDEPSGPILLLERKKGVAPRRDKRTVLGIGLLGPIPRSTEPPPVGGALAAGAESAEAVPQPVIDEEAATRRVELEPQPSRVDDGWSDGDTNEKFGPPGTTIPPPYLGAALPIEDAPSGQIPLSTPDVDSAPLVVGAPREVPQHQPTGPTGPSLRTRTVPPPADPTVLARQLEQASLALVDLLRGFDHAVTRDHVIAMLVDFVGESHHRVAFLAAKGGELTAFMQVPPPPPGAAMAHLSLRTSSTFADVVGTRLPYRGPIADAASRGLVRAMFGSATDEILAVPVAVRDRVVGVVYADGRHRHSYDEHVTVAGRAAGLALERILKGKKA